MSEPKCEHCYTCEKGVVPSVTKEQWDAADEKEQAAMAAPADCAVCYDCQSCFTKQTG